MRLRRVLEIIDIIGSREFQGLRLMTMADRVNESTFRQ